MKNNRIELTFVFDRIFILFSIENRTIFVRVVGPSRDVSRDVFIVTIHSQTKRAAVRQAENMKSWNGIGQNQFLNQTIQLLSSVHKMLILLLKSDAEDNFKIQILLEFVAQYISKPVLHNVVNFLS